MTGSASEWLDDYFDRERGTRRLGGSSWGMTDPKQFEIWGGMSAMPQTISQNFGFRLMFWREK